MISCETLTNYFGTSLSDESFQAFLTNSFVDLTPYNILESEYVVSESTGIELGFTNETAVFDDDSKQVFENGNAIFSHFNLFPQSSNHISNLPFNLTFGTKRKDVLLATGNPTKTYEGFLDLLNSHFKIDNYKKDDLIISFRYNTGTDQLSLLQFRSFSLTKLAV